MSNGLKNWLTAVGSLRPEWWGSPRARVAFFVSLLPWLIALVVFSFDWSSMGKIQATVHASPAGHRTVADAAVDGIRYAQLGYHSAKQGGPAHLTLDLGALRYVDHVKVFGRGDCCFSQSIPLRLAVSEDGSHFERVRSRKEAFSSYKPWVVGVKRKARFVRLSTNPGSFLVVSEVEAFGH